MTKPEVKWQPIHIKWDEDFEMWKIGEGPISLTKKFLIQELFLDQRLRLNLVNNAYQIDGIDVSALYPTEKSVSMRIIAEEYLQFYAPNMTNEQFDILISITATKFTPTTNEDLLQELQSA